MYFSSLLTHQSTESSLPSGKGSVCLVYIISLAHTSTVIDGHSHFVAGVPVVYVIYHTNISQCPIYKNSPSGVRVGRLWLCMPDVHQELAVTQEFVNFCTNMYAKHMPGFWQSI